MSTVAKGSRVRINLVGTLEDGTVFDSTLEFPDNCTDGSCDDYEEDEAGPVELIVGEGALFDAIEEALIGMAPGQKSTITIPAVEAYGEYDEEAVFTVERSSLPADITPEPGDQLTIYDEEDEEDPELDVTVVEISDDSITLDANHPLAGEDLQYEIELVEVLA